MSLPYRLTCSGFIVLLTAAAAADMLPLKKGIFVPAGTACKGASNADMVNYWGGRSSIGYSRATCTIKKLSQKGNTFTVTDQCKELQSGDIFEGAPTAITISDPSTFRMNGTTYRYCGPNVQF